MSEESTPATEEPRKRIDAFEKQKIKILWEVSGKGQKEIAELYGVSIARVSQILKEVEAGEKGCKMKEALTGVIAEESKTFVQKQLEEIAAFKGRTQKFIEYLMNRTMKEVQDGSAAGASLGGREKALRALRLAIMNIQTGRREFWSLHGLDKEDNLDEELPDFNIGVYSEEEIADIQRQGERRAVGALDEDDYQRIMKEAEEIEAGLTDGDDDDTLPS